MAVHTPRNRAYVFFRSASQRRASSDSILRRSAEYPNRAFNRTPPTPPARAKPPATRAIVRSVVMLASVYRSSSVDRPTPSRRVPFGRRSKLGTKCVLGGVCSMQRAHCLPRHLCLARSCKREEIRLTVLPGEEVVAHCDRPEYRSGPTYGGGQEQTMPRLFRFSLGIVCQERAARRIASAYGSSC